MQSKNPFLTWNHVGKGFCHCFVLNICYNKSYQSFDNRIKRDTLWHRILQDLESNMKWSSTKPCDRIYLFEDHIGEDITDNTYEWCAGSVTPQIDELQNLFKSWRILLSSERADEFRSPVSGGGSGNVRQQEAGRICYDNLSYSRIVDIIANLLRY